MTATPNKFLIAGAALSGVGGLIHLACIVAGPDWYRFFGAGEQIARMAAAGHWYPTTAAVFIASILFTWSLFALSGAGVIRRLPLLKLILCAITAVYLVRGTIFMFLMPYFPGNSLTFWITSSAICLAFGIVHLIGLRQVWSRL
jgi:hypothetical protein